ncbi:MAG: hypothetical protein BMS9Abin28_0122 [Anaerolineae bacterium]|nr:MAG: hypothetical protein BMS9Abin28_0122 [Anaerolineae bacterium]
MESPAAAHSKRYLELAQAFRAPMDATPDDRILEFTRLFLGPGRAIANPYESVYLESRLAGESTERVSRCYAEAGLQVGDEYPELPDHISLELAFMAHLTMKEASETPQRELWRQRQRDFLQHHLARWLPSFCQRLDQSDGSPFYRQAAQAAKTLVEQDLARLSADTHGKAPREAGTRAPWTRFEGPHPAAGPRPRRYPNIRLSVSAQCTLCTLCTDNCQQSALAVEQSSTTLSLRFEPDRCNGCRACQRLCPEDAITIHRGRPQLAPTSVGASILAAAPRVSCPSCMRPHIAAPWLDRLAERLGGDEAVRRSLALCLPCKAARGNDAALSVELGQVNARA